MFCYQCGGEMPEGVAFCHRCGAPQAADGAAATGRAFPGGGDAGLAGGAPPAFPGPPAPGAFGGAPAPAHLNIAPIGDYLLSPDEYISPHDRSAMQTLQSTGELNRLVQTFVGKFGKPWLEAGFLGNGVKIGPEQFPMLHRHASELAEVFCLTRLPDIYAVNLYYTPLAIARSTRSATIGTDTESFIVLDARLLGRLADPRLTIEQLRKDPISFLLAGELAHVALGHALWLGIAMWISLKGPSGIAGLVSRPLIMPLIYWARQAVLSADRGVVLATGLDREYRDYLLAGLVAIPRLVPMVNVDAYLRQIEGRNESVGRFLEGFSSTQPYISRRLAALDEFEREPSSPFLRRKVAAFLESQGRS